jgi:hypothetical protein
MLGILARDNFHTPQKHPGSDLVLASGLVMGAGQVALAMASEMEWVSVQVVWVDQLPEDFFGKTQA